MKKNFFVVKHNVNVQAENAEEALKIAKKQAKGEKVPAKKENNNS